VLYQANAWKLKKSFEAIYRDMESVGEPTYIYTLMLQPVQDNIPGFPSTAVLPNCRLLGAFLATIERSLGDQDTGSLQNAWVERKADTVVNPILFSHLLDTTRRLPTSTPNVPRSESRAVYP